MERPRSPGCSRLGTGGATLPCSTRGKFRIAAPARHVPLTAAQLRQRSGKPLTRIQQWAAEKSGELRHSNQAAVALANKLARVCGAVWKPERQYDGNFLPQAA